MAAARLRKAFKYPDDEDEDDGPEELDEEHQERLIAKLQAEDQKKNELYRKAFVLIPVVAGIFLTVQLFLPSARAADRLLALLGMTSLGCTAYILYFMPLEAPNSKGKIPQYKLYAAKGPIERYIVPLDGALAGVLCLAASLTWRRSQVEAALRQALPAIIFAISMVVRYQLAPLDLEELNKAKYNYKGA